MFVLTERQKETILAMADNDMRVTKAAKSMGIDSTTMYEHFRRIKRETKLDPQSLYDLVKLVEMVRSDDNA